jgi:hypothetical protein
MAPMPVSSPFPCVVHLGFAGSRHLFDRSHDAPIAEAHLENQVLEYFSTRLGELPGELGLKPGHFLCGISQIACGADSIFTRACRDRRIPQRIFLPQHRDAYLSAIGSDGKPDFTSDERKEAESLLSAEHIIQERVVSVSADRQQRFEDVNVQILRVSDVVVCLLREDAVGKPGGTAQLLERAKQRGTPVLAIRVGLRDGQPKFREQWHNQDEKHPFQPPRLPEELAALPASVSLDPLPSREEYCEPLKKLASTQAKWHQRLFKYATVVIIGTHILATLAATVALATRGHGDGHGVPWPILALLAVELLFLTIGFGVHFHLHRTRAARVWAVARVTAELARSLRAIGNRHVYLEYLFRLQLPQRFRPLLRTLSVLQLRSTWLRRDDPWEPARDQYIRGRFDDQTNGQIGFYQRGLITDERRLQRCRWTFSVCSLLAIAATAAMLGLMLSSPGWLENWAAVWPPVLETLAIMLPVMAVGGLSWAAALDCEARVETFRETLNFLYRQKPHIEQATSAAEFDTLLLETETTLLGEIANWYSRRSNMEVP